MKKYFIFLLLFILLLTNTITASANKPSDFKQDTYIGSYFLTDRKIKNKDFNPFAIEGITETLVGNQYVWADGRFQKLKKDLNPVINKKIHKNLKTYSLAQSGYSFDAKKEKSELVKKVSHHSDTAGTIVNAAEKILEGITDFLLGFFGFGSKEDKRRAKKICMGLNVATGISMDTLLDMKWWPNLMDNLGGLFSGGPPSNAEITRETINDNVMPKVKSRKLFKRNKEKNVYKIQDRLDILQYSILINDGAIEHFVEINAFGKDTLNPKHYYLDYRKYNKNSNKTDDQLRYIIFNYISSQYTNLGLDVNNILMNIEDRKEGQNHLLNQIDYIYSNPYFMSVKKQEELNQKMNNMNQKITEDIMSSNSETIDYESDNEIEDFYSSMKQELEKVKANSLSNKIKALQNNLTDKLKENTLKLFYKAINKEFKQQQLKTVKKYNELNDKSNLSIEFPERKENDTKALKNYFYKLEYQPKNTFKKVIDYSYNYNQNLKSEIKNINRYFNNNDELFDSLNQFYPEVKEKLSARDKERLTMHFKNRFDEFNINLNYNFNKPNLNNDFYKNGNKFVNLIKDKRNELEEIINKKIALQNRFLSNSQIAKLNREFIKNVLGTKDEKIDKDKLRVVVNYYGHNYFVSGEGYIPGGSSEQKFHGKPAQVLPFYKAYFYLIDNYNGEKIKEALLSTIKLEEKMIKEQLNTEIKFLKMKLMDNNTSPLDNKVEELRKEIEGKPLVINKKIEEMENENSNSRRNGPPQGYYSMKKNNLTLEEINTIANNMKKDMRNLIESHLALSNRMNKIILGITLEGFGYRQGIKTIDMHKRLKIQHDYFNKRFKNIENISNRQRKNNKTKDEFLRTLISDLYQEKIILNLIKNRKLPWDFYWYENANSSYDMFSSVKNNNQNKQFPKVTYKDFVNWIIDSYAFNFLNKETNETYNKFRNNLKNKNKDYDKFLYRYFNIVLNETHTLDFNEKEGKGQSLSKLLEDIGYADESSSGILNKFTQLSNAQDNSSVLGDDKSFQEGREFVRKVLANTIPYNLKFQDMFKTKTVINDDGEEVEKIKYEEGKPKLKLTFEDVYYRLDGDNIVDKRKHFKRMRNRILSTMLLYNKPIEKFNESKYMPKFITDRYEELNQSEKNVDRLNSYLPFSPLPYNHPNKVDLKDYNQTNNNVFTQRDKLLMKDVSKDSLVFTDKINSLRPLLYYKGNIITIKVDYIRNMINDLANEDISRLSAKEKQERRDKINKKAEKLAQYYNVKTNIDIDLKEKYFNKENLESIKVYYEIFNEKFSEKLIDLYSVIQHPVVSRGIKDKDFYNMPVLIERITSPMDLIKNRTKGSKEELQYLKSFLENYNKEKLLQEVFKNRDNYVEKIIKKMYKDNKEENEKEKYPRGHPRREY